jgi:hypothetical protein
MATQPMSLAQFGQTIKAKHPDYADIPDEELGQKVLAKYPEYKDMVSATAKPPEAQRGFTDSVLDFAKEAWKQVNPVTGIQGMAQAAAHPIDTLKNDAAARQAIYNKAEESFKKGNHVEAAAHLLYSMVPLLGPQVDAAGEQFKAGEYAKGAGASTGIAANLVAPTLLKGAKVKLPAASEGVAQRMYQSALKPSVTADAGKTAGMIKTGLENQIPISPEGLDKLNALVGDLNNKIQAQVNSSPATVSKYAVARRLNDTAKTFSNQVSPTSDMNAIAKVGNDFLDTQPGKIAAPDAQALKVGTYQQVKNKFGEMGTAQIEAQKALARGLKEELAAQFPELNSLNAKEGSLLDLEPALQRAINRHSNHQIIGIGTPIAGASAKVASGSSGVGVLAGMVKAIVDNPEVKSKLAIAIAKGSKGGLSFPAATARVQSYVNALGNAVSQGEEARQSGTQ